ncbi:MAG: hypothetical protein ACM3JG_13865 [Thiohalocapsa sp.]
MVAEVYAGLTAIKTAFDMAKGLKDIHDATLRNAAVIELQEKILAAQEAQSTLVDRARDLEREVAHLKAWDADKQRYQMEKRPPGVITLKQEAGHPCEPPHSICPTCYSNEKKSILQSGEASHGVYDLSCFVCGTKLSVGHFDPPTRTRSRPPSAWGA